MGLFDLLRNLFNAPPAGELGSGADSVRTHRAPRNPMPFDPSKYPISVEYENFLGEQKTFVGDWRSLRTRRHHISLSVAPTGQRITLSQDRIQTLAEGATAVARLPTGQQRRIMAFHKNRGTTSPLYESLLDNFPEWR